MSNQMGTYINIEGSGELPACFTFEGDVDGYYAEKLEVGIDNELKDVTGLFDEQQLHFMLREAMECQVIFKSVPWVVFAEFQNR